MDKPADPILRTLMPDNFFPPMDRTLDLPEPGMETQ